MTDILYRSAPYLSRFEAKVQAVTASGGIVLDRTAFYATGGGQPGDSGRLTLADGRELAIATTVHGEAPGLVVHVPREGEAAPAPGEAVTGEIDWERRHRHMRVHTLLHLLLSQVPFPMTGGQIAEDGGRIDFDIADPQAVSREVLEAALNRLIGDDHPVSERWIGDEELAANPGLVRTLSVKPPTGTGRVRLVAIGEGGAIDIQPCGGTHVASTAEIGPVEVAKFEKKGRINRRIRVLLA